MGNFVKALLYYLVGSVIAGSVMGAGFATNLAGRPRRNQLEAIQKLGAYIPLNVDGVDGGLVAKPDERRPTIVYVHGRSSNRMELAPLARALFTEGYNAVLWDSKNRQVTYGPQEIDQISRIIESTRTDSHVEADRIYLIGFSLGGAMSIGAAAADTDGYIRAVVADGPYAHLEAIASHYVRAFGIIPPAVVWPAKTVTFAGARLMHGIEFDSRNPADWAERVQCPVLLIHGKSDKSVPAHHSVQIMERLGGAKELWLVDRVGHTKAFAANPSKYVRRVLDFLRRSDQPSG